MSDIEIEVATAAIANVMMQENERISAGGYPKAPVEPTTPHELRVRMAEAAIRAVDLVRGASSKCKIDTRTVMD